MLIFSVRSFKSLPFQLRHPHYYLQLSFLNAISIGNIETIKNFSKENVIMMKSDYGGGGIHYDVVAKSSAVLNYGDDVKHFPEFIKLVFYITDWLYEYVFVPDIGKVPLVVNRVLVTLI